MWLFGRKLKVAKIYCNRENPPLSTGNAETSTNPCNGKGFMSYGNHLSQWTSCNVKDFTIQYELNKNNWCMPGTNSNSV